MSSPLSRRGFLYATGGAGLATVAVACGSSSTGSTASSSSSTGGGTDLQTATAAAKLEFLAVGTYTAALDAATAGKLGTVPPAVAQYAKTAKDQHQAALDKWNGVLQANSMQAVNAPDPALKQVVDQQFAQVKDITGLAQLALALEQTAANTYNAAQSTLSGKDAIALAGSIQVVDQQHCAILHYVLGQYPVPDVFQKTDAPVTATGSSSSSSS